MTEAKRRWWQSEPLDERGRKTMMTGLLIGFAVYAVSFVVSTVYAEYTWAMPVSLSLMGASVVFVLGWVFAVRRGFRVGKGRSRAERRAQMHAEGEREKRRRLMR